MPKCAVRLPAALVLVLALVAMGCSSSDGGSSGSAATTAAPAADVVASSKIGWLFVLDATAGTTSTADDGSIELALDGVADGVTTFSDRPQRSATTESPTEFVDAWASRGFNDDPPNAALVLGDETVVVLTISDPRWDANAGRLVLSATEIDDGAASVAGRTGAGVESLPATFAASSLFVDASSTVEPVTVMFDYSGSAVLDIDLDNVLAGPGPRSLASTAVEGNASVDVRGTPAANSTSINIQPTNGRSSVSVALTVLPNPDGTVTGVAFVDGQGGQLRGRFIEPAGEPTTLPTEGNFTLKPVG